MPLARGFLTGKYTKEVKFLHDDNRARLTRKQIGNTIEKVEKLNFLTEDNKRTLAQAALQFIMHRSEVRVVIPRAKTPEQAYENAKAIECESLSHQEIQKIHELISSEN